MPLKQHIFLIIINRRETISRKSSNQQKMLKNSPFSQNLYIESRFLNGNTAPLATILVLKKVKGIQKLLILFISDTN